ncbi:MAG: hypothetical protein NUV84_00325 [Candidatus Uhrbacteria bacterium]|nr:hypothetical protein [Candidatus Uhrbacteria bacterium]
MTFFTLLLVFTGFIIGLGAVTVIDLHGFLGRKSAYWTEATTRTHKVTKPMIWIGMVLATLGGVLFYWGDSFFWTPLIHLLLIVALVANGCFLSFVVSPYMLRREREGRDSELLPASFQVKIAASMIVSVIGWWGSLALFIFELSSRMV